MICFIESGRLGNQLFQYAALRTLANPGERVVLIGFSDLRDTFDGVDATILLKHTSRRQWLVTRFRPQIDAFMRHQPVVGVVSERHDEAGTHVGVTPRLIGNIRYVMASYFQSELAFTNRAVQGLSLKPQLTAHALHRLSALGTTERKRVFVHVRRGDYLRWPSPDHPAVLPAKWYKQCIDSMRVRLGDPIFVFVTDDVHYVRDVFGDMHDAHISESGPADDFALMCQCDGGILSASSFAWWASYFLKRRMPAASCLSPEYWAGHRRHEWHPPDIRSSFLESVPV